MVTLKHGKVDETFRRTTLGSCEKTIQKQIRGKTRLGHSNKLESSKCNEKGQA